MSKTFDQLEQDTSNAVAGRQTIFFENNTSESVVDNATIVSDNGGSFYLGGHGTSYRLHFDGVSSVGVARDVQHLSLVNDDVLNPNNTMHLNLSGSTAAVSGWFGTGSVILGNAWTGGTYGHAAALYPAGLDRFAEAEGLNYWVGQVTYNGSSLLDLAKGFVVSPELNGGDQLIGDHGDYLKQIYEQVLGREPDQQGFDYWLNQLNNRTVDLGGHGNFEAVITARAEVLGGFAQSDEFQARVADQIAESIRAAIPDHGGYELSLTGGNQHVIASVFDDTLDFNATTGIDQGRLSYVDTGAGNDTIIVRGGFVHGTGGQGNDTLSVMNGASVDYYDLKGTTKIDVSGASRLDATVAAGSEIAKLDGDSLVVAKIDLSQNGDTVTTTLTGVDGNTALILTGGAHGTLKVTVYDGVIGISVDDDPANEVNVYGTNDGLIDFAQLNFGINAQPGGAIESYDVAAGTAFNYATSLDDSFNIDVIGQAWQPPAYDMI